MYVQGKMVSQVLRSFDLMRLGLRQIWRQRRRHLGVVVAIALGTSGFIVMLTMGEEVKRTLNRDLVLLGGATIIKAYFDPPPFGRPQWFAPRAHKALGHLRGVARTSLVSVRFGVPSAFQGVTQSVALVAVDEFFWGVNDFTPTKGAFFGPEALVERDRVCVLGESLAKRIFGDQDPTGHFLLLDRDLFRVTGVLGGIHVGDRADFVFVPLTTARNRIEGLVAPNRVYVRCKTWNDVEHVASEIPLVIRQVQSDKGLRVEVATEQLRRVRRAAWWMELFVNAAIFTALMVGAVGIYNSMTTSVRARTREIGLKKAAGAEDGDIFVQFMSEAFCLALGSATMGVLLAEISIEGLSLLLGARAPLDLFFLNAGLGLGLALILGLSAGVYPSIRASRMEVISAVRYE